MLRTISRYELGCDLFADLCYLWEFGCYSYLSSRDLCVHITEEGDTRGLVGLWDMRDILNRSSKEWKTAMIEIEE